MKANVQELYIEFHRQCYVDMNSFEISRKEEMFDCSRNGSRRSLENTDLITRKLDKCVGVFIH